MAISSHETEETSESKVTRERRSRDTQTTARIAEQKTKKEMQFIRIMTNATIEDCDAECRKVRNCDTFKFSIIFFKSSLFSAVMFV